MEFNKNNYFENHKYDSTKNSIKNTQFSFKKNSKKLNNSMNEYLSPKFNETPSNFKKNNMNGSNLNKSVDLKQKKEEKVLNLESEILKLKNQLNDKEKFISEMKIFNYKLNEKFEETHSQINKLQDQKVCLNCKKENLSQLCNNENNKKNEENEKLYEKIRKLLENIKKIESEKLIFQKENKNYKKKLAEFEKIIYFQTKEIELNKTQIIKKNNLDFNSVDFLNVSTAKNNNKNFEKSKNLNDLSLYYENTHQLIKCISDLAIKLYFNHNKRQIY